MKKRKNYKLNTACGIQLSEGTDSGMSYLKNMMIENGMAQKRSGWKTLYSFRGLSYEPHRINGIYEYKGKEKTCLLIHAHDQLYECSYDLKEITKVPCQEGVALADKRSKGQMYGGVLWITCMGQLLIYDGDSVKRVQGSALCHVPVTSRKIRDIKQCAQSERADAPNILTAKRINTMRGIKEPLMMHRFLLDSPVKYGTPFRIKASFRVRKSDDEENELTTDYIGKDVNGDDVNTVVYVEIYTESVEEGVPIHTTAKPVDVYGDEISIGDNFRFVAYVSGNVLILAFNAAAHESAKDNIEVEFTADGDCTAVLDSVDNISVVALKNGGSVASMSVGNGTLYFNSIVDGRFYCSQDMAIEIDSAVEGITAMLPTTQSSLAIYKRNGFYILTLDGEQGRELLPSPDSLGCFGAFSATRYENECLALGSDGIYGIKDASNRSNVSTHQSMRSAPIQDELDLIPHSELEQGVACVHKGKYYLFLCDRAYVGQRNGNGEGFVWCRLDGCLARVALSCNGALYMGREDGDVAVFDGGYTDRRDYVLDERDRDFVIQRGNPSSVSFNSGVGIKEGDRVSLGEHYALWTRGVLDCKTNLIHLKNEDLFDEDTYIGPCNGDSFLITLGGNVIYDGEIQDFSPSERTIYFGNIGIDYNTELSLFLKKSEKTEYTLKAQGESYHLYFGKRPLCLYSVDIDRIYVRNSREIECALYTPITDLGGAGVLVGIDVSFSTDTRCSLEIGYETGVGAFQRQMTVGSHFDFAGLDFSDLSLTPRFKRTVKIKCLERSFDYVRLWLRSEKGEAFGVESISLIYI